MSITVFKTFYAISYRLSGLVNFIVHSNTLSVGISNPSLCFPIAHLLGFSSAQYLRKPRGKVMANEMYEKYLFLGNNMDLFYYDTSTIRADELSLVHIFMFSFINQLLFY